LISGAGRLEISLPAETRLSTASLHKRTDDVLRPSSTGCAARAFPMRQDSPDPEGDSKQLNHQQFVGFHGETGHRLRSFPTRKLDFDGRNRTKTAPRLRSQRSDERIDSTALIWSPNHDPNRPAFDRKRPGTGAFAPSPGHGMPRDRRTPANGQ
jgi:hypothetical protein